MRTGHGEGDNEDWNKGNGKLEDWTRRRKTLGLHQGMEIIRTGLGDTGQRKGKQEDLIRGRKRLRTG